MLVIVQLLVGKLSTKSAISFVRTNPIVLAKSGLSTLLIAPGVPRYATYAATAYKQNLSVVPEARWVWDGPGNNAGCTMRITVEENVTVKCLNQPLTAYIAADNEYTFNALGISGTATGLYTPETYNIPTNGVACGTY